VIELGLPTDLEQGVDEGDSDGLRIGEEGFEIIVMVVVEIRIVPWRLKLGEADGTDDKVFPDSEHEVTVLVLIRVDAVLDADLEECDADADADATILRDVLLVRDSEHEVSDGVFIPGVDVCEDLPHPLLRF